MRTADCATELCLRAGRKAMEVRDNPGLEGHPETAALESSRQQTDRGQGPVTSDQYLLLSANTTWPKSLTLQKKDERRQEVIASLKHMGGEMAVEIAAIYKSQAHLATRIQKLGSAHSGKGQRMGAGHAALLMRLEQQLDQLATELQALREALSKSFGDRRKIERELQTAREITEKLMHQMHGYPTVAKDLTLVEEVLASHWEAERKLKSKMATIIKLYENIKTDVAVGELPGGEGKQVEESVVGLRDAIIWLQADSDWLTQHVDWERDDLLIELKDVLAMQHFLEEAMSLKVNLSEVAQDATVENSDSTPETKQHVMMDVRQEMTKKLRSVSRKLSNYARAILAATTTEKLLRGGKSMRSHGFPGQRELELLSAQICALRDGVASMRQQNSTSSTTAVGDNSESATDAAAEDSFDAIRTEEKRIEKMKAKTAKTAEAIEEMQKELERLSVPSPTNEVDRIDDVYINALLNAKESSLMEAIVMEAKLDMQEKKVEETRAAMLDAVAESVKRDELQTTIMSRLGKIIKTIEILKKEKTVATQTELESLESEKIKLGVDLSLAHEDFHLAETVVVAYAAKLKEARDRRKKLKAALEDYYGQGSNGSNALLGKEAAVAQGYLSSLTQWRDNLEKALHHTKIDASLQEAQRMSTWKDLQSLNRDISRANRGPRVNLPKQSLLAILKQQRAQLRSNLREANQNLKVAQKAAVDIEEKLERAKAKQSDLERDVSSKLLEQNEQMEINALREDLDTAEEKAFTLKLSVLEARGKVVTKENLKDSFLRRLAEIVSAIHALGESPENSMATRQRLNNLKKKRHALKFELREAMNQLHIVQMRLVHLNSSFTKAVLQLKEAEWRVNQRQQMATLGSVASRVTLCSGGSTPFSRRSKENTRNARPSSQPVSVTRSLDFQLQ